MDWSVVEHVPMKAKEGAIDMSDSGKNDKGKKEQKKKAKLTLKEKRKAKNDKKQIGKTIPSSGS
jgi:hypothetical protein